MEWPSNIFGAGFPSKFIPSFTWGGIDNSDTFQLEKAIELARIVMKRRSIELSEQDQKILESVFELTKKYRVKYHET